jgi:ABC-type iron transport system FetAB ATPase subunit
MDATPTTPALRIAGLRSALAGPFDLSLARGACVGISGPSGSGKSLFLRMIADLDPNEGEVFLNGVARSSLTGPAWRRRAVYVPAESGWWSEYIADHFAKDRLDAVKTLVARLGLPDGILDQPVSRLSTGERQRLALIRALVVASPVLLLDEPTSALDGDGALAVETILGERMAEGTAIVLVTHNPAQAERLAGARLTMTAGKLEAMA